MKRTLNWVSCFLLTWHQIGWHFADQCNCGVENKVTCPHCRRKIDPATIPDAVILAERARRNQAKRATRSGGRNGGRPQCTCGTCKACVKRARESK